MRRLGVWQAFFPLREVVISSAPFAMIGSAAAAVALGVGYALGRSSSKRNTSLIQKAVDALPRATRERANPMPSDASKITLPATLPKTGLGDASALDALAPAALDGCAQLSHPGYLAHMDPASAEVRSRIDLACCVIGDAIQHSDQHICYDVVVDVTQ